MINLKKRLPTRSLWLYIIKGVWVNNDNNGIEDLNKNKVK